MLALQLLESVLLPRTTRASGGQFLARHRRTAGTQLWSIHREDGGANAVSFQLGDKAI